MDEYLIEGRVLAIHRCGDVLDIYCNVNVLAESPEAALVAGAQKIASQNGGNPETARWVGTLPTPWNRSEAIRKARYYAFDWSI